MFNKKRDGVEMKKCIECNGTPYNKRSNLCSQCFENILKTKIKEGEEDQEKENRIQENRYNWF